MPVIGLITYLYYQKNQPSLFNLNLLSSVLRFSPSAVMQQLPGHIVIKLRGVLPN